MFSRVKYIVLFTVVSCVSADYGGSDAGSLSIPPAPPERKPHKRPSFVAYPSPQASYPSPSVPLPPSDPCLEYPTMFPAGVNDGYGPVGQVRPRYHHRRRHSVHHGSSGGYGNEASYVRPAFTGPVDSGYGFVRENKIPTRKVVVEDAYAPQQPVAPVAPPIINNDGYSDDDGPIIPVAPARRRPVRPVIEESNGYGSYGEGGYGSNVASGSSGY